MGLDPVFPDPAFSDQFDPQVGRMFHAPHNDFANLCFLAFQQIDDELVVDLKNHLGFQSSFRELTVYGDHGQLHDVGRTALNRGVDGVAFGQSPHHGIARPDVGQHPFSTEEGGHVAGFMRLCNDAVHVLLYARIGGEIAVDDHFGLGAGNVQPLGQSECRDAVDDTEIGGLGPTELLAGDLLGRNRVDLGGGGRVDVRIVGKGIEQVRITAQVGHQPQFDL